MKARNIGDVNQLQGYFMSRIGAFLESKGKRMIGWDEILEGDLPKDATIMSWRGYNGAVHAANADHDVVMSPYTHCYFDMYDSHDTKGRLNIGGYVPLHGWIQ